MDYRKVLYNEPEYFNDEYKSIFSINFLNTEIIPAIYIGSLFGIGHFIGIKLMNKILNN